MPLQNYGDVGDLLDLENFHRIQLAPQMGLDGRDHPYMRQAVPRLGRIHRRVVGQRIGPDLQRLAQQAAGQVHRVGRLLAEQKIKNEPKTSS